MKKLLLLFAAFFIQQGLFAQGVGINTLSPDPSAALDIKSPNNLDKGVLIPKVYLKSLSDITTIPNPAHSLLIYNTNPELLTGSGYYFNDNSIIGTAKWTNLSHQFELPLAKTVTTNLVGLDIANFGAPAFSAAIRGHHGGSGIGVRASSVSGVGLDVSGGVKIAGNGQSPGVGKVLTSDANGNATWEGAVAFLAQGITGGGSEVFAANTPSKVPFKDVIYDLGGNYKNSNGAPHSTFKAPVNGIYHFEAELTWGPNDGPDAVSYSSEIVINMVRNGNMTSLSETKTTSIKHTQSIKVSTDCLLQTGDEISIIATQYSAGYVPLFTANKFAHFSGRLILKQ